MDIYYGVCSKIVIIILLFVANLFVIHYTELSEFVTHTLGTNRTITRNDFTFLLCALFPIIFLSANTQERSAK